MEHLHNEQYYLDIYDLLTIKDCLEKVKIFREIYKKSLADKKTKDIPKEEKIRALEQLLGEKLFVLKGERYRSKAKRIEEMVENDRKKQDFYDSAKEPTNIRCNTCDTRLFSETKILEDYMDSPMRVLFFFPCKKCKVKRGVYDNGEEHVSKPRLCPKCNHELSEKHKVDRKDKNPVITWTRNCPNCKFKETEVDDFEKSHLECEEKQQKDKELLAKYRKDFCLTEEEGKEYIETIEKLKYASTVFEKEKAKHEQVAYQQTIKAKKLTIVDLETMLSKLFEKQRYIKLSLEKPEISQFVIVPFTVQDADSSRKNYESTRELEKILKPILEETNWRLVSNSLSYRLGYVSGQLKGYERDEDILKLFQPKQEIKRQENDSEKQMKYGGDNMVQLARMLGEHAGVQSMRKKRLKKETEGFFLEVSEGPLNCGVCYESTPGNDIWWTEENFYCRNCWKNIREGVIPPLKHVYDKDKVYYRDWQIQSEFSLHPSTVKKLKRDGVLKGRDLKDQDGDTYCTIYMIKDNKEFFKKYPKKPVIDVKFVNNNPT